MRGTWIDCKIIKKNHIVLCTKISKIGEFCTHTYRNNKKESEIIMKNKNNNLSKEFVFLFSNCVGYGKLFAPNEVGLKCFAEFYSYYMKYKAMSKNS